VSVRAMPKAPIDGYGTPEDPATLARRSLRRKRRPSPTQDAAARLARRVGSPDVTIG
jgi:hypothetical protein